jgi:hypothetical protein
MLRVAAGIHTQPAPVESTGNPVTDALKATPELEGWQSADPDRFSLAVHLDEKLQADPAWKDKPLTERFSEVVNAHNYAGIAVQIHTTLTS